MINHNVQFSRYKIVKHTADTQPWIQSISVIPLIMAVITLFCALCSISCASVQTDIRYSGGAGSAREKVLETLEATMDSPRIQYNPEQLKRTQAEIYDTLREHATDSPYLARWHALSADVSV